MAKCRYWLAIQEDAHHVRLVDGCHNDPEGVARAAKLHKRIFKADDEWVMIEIHPMPDLDPPIDEESADICAALADEGETE